MMCKNNAVKDSKNGDSIAIIGIACVYPGALSAKEFFENILAGRREFRKVPSGRWKMKDYYSLDVDEPDKTNSDKMAVIKGWEFNPSEFRIPPVSYRVTDLVQWLALSTARDAIQDARLDFQCIDRTRAGAIIANTLTGEFTRSLYLRHRWPYMQKVLREALTNSGLNSGQIDRIVENVHTVYNARLEPTTEDSLQGALSNTIAGRICNYFDFNGGGYTVDGACASSLLAVITACRALIDNDMDIALAGGVDISLDPLELVSFAKMTAVTKDDIRVYDKRASGFLPGEGCGVVVLRRLNDAIKAGNHVYGIIKGWGISSDGNGGITAPKVGGQALALRRAYERAGYSIADIGMIEGHGTGTPVGDNVELQALTKVLKENNAAPYSCAIGTIKSNIGHCKAAAGMAGFIKATLALYHQILPPTMNIFYPHDVLIEQGTPLYPLTNGNFWLFSDKPRRAGVSGMGFGGINSHITLEEYKHPIKEEDDDDDDDDGKWDNYSLMLNSGQTTEVLFFSEDSISKLISVIKKLLPIVGKISFSEMTDLAAELASRCEPGRWKAAIVARSPWDLIDKIHYLIEKVKDLQNNHSLIIDNEKMVFVCAPETRPKIAFLFPGQGSQTINMGINFYRRYPFGRDFYHRLELLVKKGFGFSPMDFIFKDTDRADNKTKKQWQEELTETHIAQPCLALSELAAMDVLRFFGIYPDIVAGHSLGEISAYAASGIIEEETAIQVAAMRGQSISELVVDDPGMMLAVFDRPQTVENLLLNSSGYSVIANYNSPKQTVVSGDTKTIKALRTRCKEENIPCKLLKVSHAFHSDIISDAARTLYKNLDSMVFNPAKITMISTVTGKVVDSGNDIRGLIAEQIKRPVNFVGCVETLAALSPDLIVEAGPGNILIGLLRQCLGSNQIPAFALDPVNEEPFESLNSLLACAYVMGASVEPMKLFQHRFYRDFDIDNYSPKFITNPCEQELPDSLISELPVISLSSESSLFNSDILKEKNFHAYLESRERFLRDFISLDYHNFSDITNGMISAGRDGQQSEKEVFVPKKEDRPQKIENYDGAIQFTMGRIAKRTGYPQEMIKPEMRLKEDLGLDSIKVIELAQMLSNTFGVKSVVEPARWANSKIEELVLYMWNDRGEQEESIAIDATGVTELDKIDNWVRTFNFDQIDSPLAKSDDIWNPQGLITIAALKDDPFAKRFGQFIKERGYKAEYLDLEYAERRKQLDNIFEGETIAGLVLFLPSHIEDIFDLEPERFEKRLISVALSVLHVTQFALTRFDNSFDGKRLFYVWPTDINKINETGSFAATLKTVVHEYPGLSGKAIGFDPELGAEKIIETIYLELQNNEPPIEVAYLANGKRVAPVARLEVSEGNGPLPELGSDDVVLVSGGGKGITAELALALGRETGVKLALLGTSPLPTTEEIKEASVVNDSNSNHNELAKNLNRFSQAGIKYAYFQCNVADIKDVRHAIEGAGKELGKITGVLHGAGISQPQPTIAFDDNNFINCIKVKAIGFYNLMRTAHKDGLKFVHVISSVAAKTGMQGQADYTFANEWLNNGVIQLSRQYPDIQFLAIGYSVWEEAGMGVKLDVLEFLQNIGLSYIPTVDGVKNYIDALHKRHVLPVLIIIGHMRVFEQQLFGDPSFPSWRFLEEKRNWVPSVELVTEAELSTSTDPYLNEHVFNGTILFPAVMEIEAMVQAACACTGMRDELPVLRNIQFFSPITLPPEGSVRIRILTLADKPTDNGWKVRVAIRCESTGFKIGHFSGECWFNLPAPQKLATISSLPDVLPYDPEDFHPSPLFQGKFFRRIASIRKLEFENESIAEVGIVNNAVYFSDSKWERPLTGPVVSRDSFFHAGAIVLPAGALPKSIDEWHINPFNTLSTKAISNCFIRKLDKLSYLTDLNVYSENGDLVEYVKNVAVVIVDRSKPEQKTAVKELIPIPAKGPDF